MTEPEQIPVEYRPLPKHSEPLMVEDDENDDGPFSLVFLNPDREMVLSAQLALTHPWMYFGGETREAAYKNALEMILGASVAEIGEKCERKTPWLEKAIQTAALDGIEREWNTLAEAEEFDVDSEPAQTVRKILASVRQHLGLPPAPLIAAPEPETDG